MKHHSLSYPSLKKGRMLEPRAAGQMDDELFDAFDPEVLATNGIEYPLGDPYNLRTRVQMWAYLMMQTNCHLVLDRMVVPPEGSIRFPEFIAKGWGWWRLLPIYWNVGPDMPLYRKYLCEYYIRNAPESVDGAATVERVVTRSAWTNKNGRLAPLARSCLEMETKLMAECGKQNLLTDSEAKLSGRVKLCALQIIDRDGGDYVGAYAAAAALVCITKKAELMREWVIRGQYNSSDPKCMESNQIRELALSLALYKGSGSITAAAGAAMVGAAKEAKLLTEWLRQDPKMGRPDVTMCTDIREEACDILRDMHCEAFGSNGSNSIADADDGEEKTTSDKEDPEWKPITGSRIEIAAFNGNKENTENVNQKKRARKLKRKLHHYSTGEATNVRTRR